MVGDSRLKLDILEAEIARDRAQLKLKELRWEEMCGDERVLPEAEVPESKGSIETGVMEFPISGEFGVEFVRGGEVVWKVGMRDGVMVSMTRAGHRFDGTMAQAVVALKFAQVMAEREALRGFDDIRFDGELAGSAIQIDDEMVVP